MSLLVLLLSLSASTATTTGLQAMPQTWEELWTWVQTVSVEALDFMSGVPIGLRENLVVNSRCVQSYVDLAPQWDSFLEKALTAWNYSVLIGVFDILEAADVFLTAILSSGQRCELWLLIDRFGAIFSISGFLFFAEMVYLNLDYIYVRLI